MRWADLVREPSGKSADALLAERIVAEVQGPELRVASQRARHDAQRRQRLVLRTPYEGNPPVALDDAAHSSATPATTIRLLRVRA